MKLASDVDRDARLEYSFCPWLQAAWPTPDDYAAHRLAEHGAWILNRNEQPLKELGRAISTETAKN